MIVAEGDRKVAAAILGITYKQLETRIREHQQLRAVWGQAGVNSPAGLPAPREADVMNRRPLDLPPIAPTGVELAEMVSAADKEFHELGLKKMGISEKLLKRIRDLDGLAPSSGSFIAISLEKVSRSYYVQVMELMEMAKDLRDSLMTKGGQPGYIADDKARAYFNKNYIEMVKEAGRAYELFLTGAQVMVEMMIKTKGLEMPNGKKKKHGWEIMPAPEVKRHPMPPPPD